MSNELRGEDTILGTALARAIASQPIRSTPFERSRVAVRMAGGGGSPLVPVLAAAAAVVLGLALGAALLGQRGPTDPGGGATQPTASPGTTASPAGSPVASPTATPEGNERIWVYFARDQLPPVGAYVRGTMAEDRISSRLVELHRAGAAEVPPGTTNVVARLGREEGGGWASFGSAVSVEGDLATVTFASGAFERIRGAAATQALIQQLVYTITEEPGIRRALIKEQGRDETVIDQLVIDAPLAREDVLPYEGVKTEERIALEDDPRPSTATTRIEDLVAGIRFIIELKATETPEGGFWSPRLAAELAPSVDSPKVLVKSILTLDLPAVTTSTDGYRPTGDAGPGSFMGMQTVDRSPLRWVELTRVAGASPSVRYRLGLDDARPWRISLEPGAERGTMRLIVDIGGHPQAVSDNVAVYGPKPGDEVSRTFTLTGAARAFEAHVSWRIKDSSGREVATGFTTASLGTSPVWGMFTTEVRIPDNVSGAVTLEVFWPSPRDGADVGKVSIPLRVR